MPIKPLHRIVCEAGQRVVLDEAWPWPNTWRLAFGADPVPLVVPLSCCRIDAGGGVVAGCRATVSPVDAPVTPAPQKARGRGKPALAEALATMPDGPGPLVWVLPDAPAGAAAMGSPGPSPAAFGEAVVRHLIGLGLPLNTLIAAADLAAAPLETLDQGLYFCLLPRAGDLAVPRLLELLELGTGVLFHGPVEGADPRVLAALGLEATAPVAGSLCLATAEGDWPLEHAPAASGGGVAAQLGRPEAGPPAVTLAWIGDGPERRVYAVRRGRAAWLRGSFASLDASGAGQVADESCDPCELVAPILAGLGLIAEQQTGEQGCPVTFAIKRHANACWIAGDQPDPTARLFLAAPDGVPIARGQQVGIGDGFGCYAFEGVFHCECRVFVRQRAGLVGCHELDCPEDLHRRLRVTGLDEATVTIYPEPDWARQIRIVEEVTSIWDDERQAVQIFGVSGSVTVTW